ncbi:hypothetical protein EMCG_02698 [[Emmonsia] crescens]|uniref:Uncharacterized protein n=1 Tax=[Emmonsia] crescens TaxID=73230 RepID=A0A0G2J8X4_9EURO|nr:hypothetical protein EMCG_02698 [Emmonsia crescens UAMH 3008]
MVRIKNTTLSLSAKIEKLNTSMAILSLRAITRLEPEDKLRIRHCRSNTFPPNGTHTAICGGSGGHDKRNDKENVEPPLSLAAKLADDVSVDGPLKETPATVSESPSTHVNPDPGSRHILMCRKAGDGRLEYLLWAST